ncbi:helix-turn-helix domain-containing protein [Nitrosospira sp. NpAV]|uniref:helix-turn-helix domain-containing protein n=1 Tax=Nitrosospira sp. NpAV TaxID=58133 RepID=UPI0005A2F75E|nr:helix-turn-helix transcriptional regulator [Nitrosospira sp. NpAV]KIO48486.1 hypothetical protein SQ11_12225 [Nitrosospira sp. NpAV]
MSDIQFIERNGKREYAIVPIEIFERLVKASADIGGIALYDKAKAVDDGSRIPGEVTHTILEGTHPIKAWRTYRKLTQQALAEKAGISKPFLSQIEGRKRVGTIAVLTALSRALDVPVNLLAE